MKVFRYIATASFRRSPGFTLVELLVSMAVLTLMAVMLVVLTGAVNKIWLGGKDRMDNYSRARSALDAITRDLQTGIFRLDVGAFTGTDIAAAPQDPRNYYKLASDIPFVFYTQRPGIPRAATTPAASGPSRLLSLVAYKIEHSTTNMTLKRGDLPVDWDSAANLVSFSLNALPQQDKILYQDACPGVLRAEFYFLRANGQFSVTSNVDPADTTDATGTLRAPVLAVAVTLAVVDDTARKYLSDSGRCEELRDALIDKNSASTPAFPGTTPFTESARSIWEKKADGPELFATYPSQVRNGLRFYERFIYLPKNQ